MDPDDTIEAPPRRPSRLRSLLQVLRGDPVVPVAIRAEWTAWQFELEGLCDKLTVCASRLYQRDVRKLDVAMKRIAELEAGVGASPDMAEVASGSASTWNPAKIALYRQARALTGTKIPAGNGIPGGENVSSD